MSSTYAKTPPTADEVKAVLGPDCAIESHSNEGCRFSRDLTDSEREAVEALYRGVLRKIA